MMRSLVLTLVFSTALSAQGVPTTAPPQPDTQKATTTPGAALQGEFIRKAFAPEILSQWALLVLGIVGSCFAYHTVVATKKSADAAKKSADALMLGDRAWVLIEADSMKEKIQAPYLPTDEQLMVEQRMPHCVFFFKNCGKTPAKITACRFELEISDNPNVPPHSRAYDSPEGFNPFMLAQDGSAPFEARMNSVQKMTQECASVTKGLRSLWLCGIIKYVDVFERGADSEHETRFCYVWETRMNTLTPFWSMRGDTNYNRFT